MDYKYFSPSKTSGNERLESYSYKRRAVSGNPLQCCNNSVEKGCRLNAMQRHPSSATCSSRCLFLLFLSLFSLWSLLLFSPDIMMYVFDWIKFNLNSNSVFKVDSSSTTSRLSKFEY